MRYMNSKFGDPDSTFVCWGADFGLGMVARWVDVEVAVEAVVVRDPMHKYRSTIGCETSLMELMLGGRGLWGGSFGELSVI